MKNASVQPSQLIAQRGSGGGLFQPIKDQTRCLIGHLLLDPMSARQGGHVHIWNDRGQGFGSGDDVLISVDHECGHRNDRINARQDVPVAIHLPVLVDAAGNSAGLKGRSENRQISIV